MIRPAAAELALIATVLLALAARADAQPDPPPIDAELRAAELFDLGIARKRSGDLDGACVAFAESQALDPSLGTQLNLAACLERAGRFDDALALLRTTFDEATLRGDQRPADRARAEIDRLEARLAAITTAAPRPPEPRPSMRAPRPLPGPRRAADAAAPRTSRWPFLLGVGAGALTAGGVALVLWGHDQQQSADAACPVNGLPGCDAVAAQELNDAAVMKSRLGTGMLVGGVVIAETALYLWWRGRDDRRERKPARHTGLVAAPGGAVVTYEGRFQ